MFLYRTGWPQLVAASIPQLYQAGGGTIGGSMLRRGQTTTFPERLDITERAAAGQSDPEIAAALGCSLWTVRKWRSLGQHQGRTGLSSQMGCPTTGPLSTLPTGMRNQMREVHFDATQGCFLGQRAGSESILTFAPQGLTKTDLMGELGHLLTLSAYQLALPFTHEAWRQLEYTRVLAGTTL